MKNHTEFEIYSFNLTKITIKLSVTNRHTDGPTIIIENLILLKGVISFLLLFSSKSVFQYYRNLCLGIAAAAALLDTAASTAFSV